MNIDVVASPAGPFQAGNTCPACQGVIEEGQEIVRCPKCGGLHHQMCWQSYGRCASYHCDPRTKADVLAGAPLVITATETENVVVPPKTQLNSAQVTEPFLPQSPSRMSILAVLSLAAAVLGIMTLAGIILDQGPLTVFGFAFLLCAIVVGVIALVITYSANSRRGSALAMIAVGMATLVTLVSVGIIGVRQRAFTRGTAAKLEFAATAPTEEELNQLPPTVADALRANVVVQTAFGGFTLGGMGLASGTVLRVVDNVAYILTNHHAIAPNGKEANSIEITFYNGESSEAKVEWLAPGEVDLAVLSCEALTLDKLTQRIVLAENALQGQQVFAIGNPMNLTWTYSQGVIGAARQQQFDGHTITIYQTQAPIRMGSSGGGLYNMEGVLVGVNTWTEDKDTREGLAFAISSQSFLKLLPAELRDRFLAPAAGKEDAPE